MDLLAKHWPEIPKAQIVQDKESQKIIDETYGMLWSVIDDLDSIKANLIEQAEKLKSILSPEYFK